MKKIIYALIFTLIVTALFPVTSFANGRTKTKITPVAINGFSITPTFGAYFFSGAEHMDITESFGLKIGYDNAGKSFTDSLGVEAYFNYFTTRSKMETDNITGYLLRLEAIYPIPLWAKWVPFVALGGGGIIIDTASNTETRPLINYGAGVKYFLQDDLALRADARHLLVYKNVDTRNNFEVTFGVNYYFGKDGNKNTASAATVNEEKEEPKTDTGTTEF